MQMLLDDLPLAHPNAQSVLPPGVFRGGFTGLVSDSVNPKPLTLNPKPFGGGFTGLVSDSVPSTNSQK
jgi:hypothetical protein